MTELHDRRPDQDLDSDPDAVLDTSHDTDANLRVEPIAIIGMAARVGGAGNVEQLWQNLIDGVEAVTSYTLDEQRTLMSEPDDVDDPDFVPRAFVVDDFDKLDIGVFGMSAREAELSDPQQRMMLELAHTALEDAGIDPARFAGDVGVYTGTGLSGYVQENLRANPTIWKNSGQLGISIGNSPDYLSTNISYKLNLRGPSMTVTTACSTSLVAAHLACEALRNHECDLALAGGVSIELPHGAGYISHGGFTSPTGQVRPFDADAQGTVWGSGAGAVVLKRLSDAIADGDTVRAVIIGNAVNNDGATKVGFSAPSVQGQVAVIDQAFELADIDPRTVGYVEAHGTGTALGDPIEIESLTRAFYHRLPAGAAQDRQWCAVGSMKSNLGHLSQAAGVVSLIKAVLVVERGQIPPSLNYTAANPAIDFAGGPFFVADSLTAFPPDTQIRRAGVSSFGIGGTNAHVLVEQAPPLLAASAGSAGSVAPTAHLLRISAHTPSALATAAGNLADHLQARPWLSVADVAATLANGRTRYRHRGFVVASDAADAVARLRNSKRMVTGEDIGSTPPIAFLFSGQGSQYPGMGAGLYAADPTFRATVDECAELLAPQLGLDLRELLLAERADSSAEARLRETWLTQPALFTIEYALAQWWIAGGVRPTALLGHSIGEYVAATVAGVLSLTDALTVVATRGRLMQSMPAGAMAAIQLDAADVQPLLVDGVEIATVNGPGTCVVGGSGPAVDGFLTSLPATVNAKRLRTSHAFHTASMEPILAEFGRAVADASPQVPQLPLVAGVTGEWMTDDQATDPGYWADQLRHAVRFGAGVATVLTIEGLRLLECGPGRQLAGLARMQVRGSVPLTSLPAPDEQLTDLAVAYDTAGKLWCAGYPLDPPAAAPAGRRIPLPTYPYERQRYWIDPTPRSEIVSAAVTSGSVRAAASGPLTSPLDWFAVPTWHQLPSLPPGPTPTRVLVIGDGPRATELGRLLATRGCQVDTTGAIGVDPQSIETITAAVDEQPEGLQLVHAGALDADPADGDPETAMTLQDTSFFQVLALLQLLAGRAEPPTVRVDLVSAATSAVTGTELLRTEQATLAGVCKVAPLELPTVTVRRIETDDDTPIGTLADELCAAVQPDTAEVALRGGRRWRREFEQVSLPEAMHPVTKDGGRYLITGGTGGIGITLAEDLAIRHQARLLLVARTPLLPRTEWASLGNDGPGAGRIGRAIAAVQRMEAAGAQVKIVAADVTDQLAVSALADTARQLWGGLDGIVHAAGLPGGGMIEVKEPTDARLVMAPKIAGTLALKRAFADLPMDFIALCSSITAVTGDFGQVDYCAANAFMDAEAGNTGWSGPVQSLNWGGWSDVGMAVETRVPAEFAALRAGSVDRAVGHPLLTRAAVTGDAGWAEGDLGADTHWVLDEHRIGDDPVLPGTGLLELTRAAYAACYPDDQQAAGRQIQLTDVAFVEPLRIPDGSRGTVRVEFDAAADAAEFRVVSTVGDRTAMHAQGSVGWVAVAEPAVVALGAMLAAGTEKGLTADGMFRADGGRSSVVQFGPRWNALQQHWFTQGGEIALVRAPAAAAGDSWILHPALLDVATAFSDRGEGNYLPMGYGEFTVFRPLPCEFYSLLSYRGDDASEMVTADLLLVDRDGVACVQIREFALRRIDPDAVTDRTASVPDTLRDTASDGGRLTTTTMSDPARPEPGRISPADGVLAFQRALGSRLGCQLVINPWTVDETLARVRSTGTAVTPEMADTDPEDTTGGLEASIARIWSDVLGVADVGPDSDFFALGGNSLVAVQLIGQVRKAVGVRLPMRSLFDGPTVREMADQIAEQLAEQQAELELPPATAAAAAPATGTANGDGDGSGQGSDHHTPPGNGVGVGDPGDAGVMTIPRLARPTR